MVYPSFVAPTAVYPFVVQVFVDVPEYPYAVKDDPHVAEYATAPFVYAVFVVLNLTDKGIIHD